MPIRSKLAPRGQDKPEHREVFFMEGVPATTKAAFKSHCAKNGKTMRDIIIMLMRGYAEGKIKV